MKFAITEIVEYDYEGEINRIHEAFEEPWKSRLLEIIEAFKNEECQKVLKLYDKLPRDEEYECAGQEFCDPEMISLCYKVKYRPETIKKIE
jgi:hypothetical protein